MPKQARHFDFAGERDILATILFLFGIFGGSPLALIARLDSPCYRTRERAELELRRSMTYPLAIRLALVSHDSAEVRMRVKRASDSLWGGFAFDLKNAPHIDTLSNPRCSGCACQVSSYYLRRAQGMNQDCEPYFEFRYGTQLLVLDLIRWRVPPCLIRGLLVMMTQRTDAWKARNRMKPVRMPDLPMRQPEPPPRGPMP